MRDINIQLNELQEFLNFVNEREINSYGINI